MNELKTNKKSIRILISLLLTAPQFLVAGGIVAIKEQKFHRDSSANVFLYEKIKRQGPFVFIYVKGGKRYSFNSSKTIESVELYDAFPANILKEKDVTLLKENLSKVNEFSKKYTKSSVYLKKYLNSLKNELTQYENDSLKYEGRWISKKEYSEILEKLKKEQVAKELREKEMKAQAEISKAKEREEREKARKEYEKFVKEQKERGFVEYNGRWVPEATAQINRMIDAGSQKNAIFEVFQFLDEGDVFVKTQKGELVHVRSDKDWTLVSDRIYRENLYYCGTYTYRNRNQEIRRIRSFCSSREKAFKVIQASRNSEGKPRASTGGKRPSNGEKSKMKGSGSGFFIGRKGYVVTNKHVVERASAIKISHEGIWYKGKVVAVSETEDLAILKIEKDVNGLLFTNEEATLGADIFALGFPHPDIQGSSIKVTKGVISSLKGMNDNDSYYQIDAAVQAGNSGGPIINKRGVVLGVVTSKLSDLFMARRRGDLTQNVNYAIKTSRLVTLLRSKGITINEPPRGSISDGVERAAKSVSLVSIETK